MLSKQRALVLDCDLRSAALLRHFVAVAVHVSVLPWAWEAGATLGQWTARLALWAALLVVTALRAVIVVGEGAVAADWAWVLEATKATWAPTEAGAQCHVAEAVDEGGLATLGQAGGRCHQTRCVGLGAVTTELLQACDVVAERSWEASCGRRRRWRPGTQLSVRFGCTEVVASRTKAAVGVTVAAQIARALVAQSTAIVVVANIAEVRCRSSVQ